MFHMTEKLRVRVTYKNEDMKPVCEKEYELDKYTQMIRNDLMRIITDVEDVLYCALNGQSKDEWTSEINAKFRKIKHKILDKAGEVGRLPQNIVEDDLDKQNITEWIANIFNSKK